MGRRRRVGEGRGARRSTSEGPPPPPLLLWVRGVKGVEGRGWRGVGGRRRRRRVGVSHAAVETSRVCPRPTPPTQEAPWGRPPFLRLFSPTPAPAARPLRARSYLRVSHTHGPAPTPRLGEVPIPGPSPAEVRAGHPLLAPDSPSPDKEASPPDTGPNPQRPLKVGGALLPSCLDTWEHPAVPVHASRATPNHSYKRGGPHKSRGRAHTWTRTSATHRRTRGHLVGRCHPRVRESFVHVVGAGVRRLDTPKLVP